MNTGVELTIEQIEKCIADNVTITDWRLLDGVIGAVMDAVVLFAKENEMLLGSLPEPHEHTPDCYAHGCRFQTQDGSLPEPVVEAYGWLWHDISVNPRTQKARQLLTATMTKEQMRAGIDMAKENGADMAGVGEDRVCSTK